MCFLVVFIVLAIFQPASAQERQHPKLGFYLEVPVYYNTYGGDFDGEHFFDSGTEFIMVPDPESNYGFGIIVGRRRPNFSAEVGYVQIRHDYTYLDHNEKMTLSLFLLNSKFYATKNKVIQPYFLSEFAIAYLKVKDGALTVNPPIVFRDTSFLGLTLGAGAGLSLQPIPEVSLHAGVIFSWLTFGSVNVGGERHRLDALNSFSFNFRAGLRYTF